VDALRQCEQVEVSQQANRVPEAVTCNCSCKNLAGVEGEKLLDQSMSRASNLSVLSTRARNGAKRFNPGADLKVKERESDA
jgi:hypothetical protein